MRIYKNIIACIVFAVGMIGLSFAILHHENLTPSYQRREHQPLQQTHVSQSEMQEKLDQQHTESLAIPVPFHSLNTENGGILYATNVYSFNTYHYTNTFNFYSSATETSTPIYQYQGRTQWATAPIIYKDSIYFSTDHHKKFAALNLFNNAVRDFHPQGILDFAEYTSNDIMDLSVQDSVVYYIIGTYDDSKKEFGCYLYAYDIETEEDTYIMDMSEQSIGASGQCSMSFYNRKHSSEGLFVQSMFGDAGAFSGTVYKVDPQTSSLQKIDEASFHSEEPSEEGKEHFMSIFQWSERGIICGNTTVKVVDHGPHTITLPKENSPLKNAYFIGCVPAKETSDVR